MKNQPSISENLHLIGVGYLTLIPILALLLSLIPMRSSATVVLPFLNEGQTENKVLVFGGFPDCSSTCPLSLSTMQQAYERYQLITNKNDLRILFANIKLDTPDEITRTYAKSFHEDFESYSIKSTDATHFYKTLALKTFSTDKKNKSHKGFIYLFSNIDQKWKLEKIFDQDADQDRIVKYLLKKTA